jgi:predicted metal-dependent enzyme (double-stranded beta helix superfamily)
MMTMKDVDRSTTPTLPAGAAELVERLSQRRHDRAAIVELVTELVSNPEGLERLIGADERCGITVLAATPELTVQRVVWPAGIRIPPHDHRTWAVAGVVRGGEDNRLLRRCDDRLEEAGQRRIEAGEVLDLDDTMIHAVANPSSQPCLALHVYGGDLDHTPRSTWTPDEHPFDPGAMWAAIDRLRAVEDRLGRPLTGNETAQLTRR